MGGLTYAEELYDASGQKGNRNDIEGKQIAGLYDELVADGGADRRFAPLWWRSWRFLELHVKTADEPLTLEGFKAFATGFPFQKRARFASDDPELGRIFDVSYRTMRLAGHETYMDAPYWEQLQYWIHVDTGTSQDEAIKEEDGRSLAVTLQLVETLRQAAELEEALGDAGRAILYRRRADASVAAVRALFDSDKALLPDTPERRTWGHPVNLWLRAEITLPEGLPGRLTWKGRSRELRAGTQVLELP